MFDAQSSPGRLLLLPASLAFMMVASAQPSDKILVNGKVLTVDEKFTITEAVAVTGQRISAVGGTADIKKLAGPPTQVIDLQGRTVIPGLIDNHLHYLRGAAAWRVEAHRRHHRTEGSVTDHRGEGQADGAGRVGLRVWRLA